MAITMQLLVEKDPGLTGNLLVERLVGAHIDLVSKEEYSRIGSVVWFNEIFFVGESESCINICL